MKKIFLISLMSIIVFACKNNESGCIEGNCENGHGVILYTNGGTATGYFKNGKLNGYGKIVFGKGWYEGDTIRGNFENSIAKGDVVLYNAGIDATFIGSMDGNYNVEHTDDPLTGHFKVYFGKNSLWQGTFEGDFVNGTSKEWEERIDVSRAKNGKYVAKSARLFLSAIVCFTRRDDAIRQCNAPLERIYKKDLTTETVSSEEIQELTDSLQAQKSLLLYSLSKLNQLEEFDKKILLKGILCEQMNQMLDRIDNDMLKLVAILAQPPSKKKPREIYYNNKAFDNKSDKLVTKYSKANRKFENKYIIFNND